MQKHTNEARKVCAIFHSKTIDILVQLCYNIDTVKETNPELKGVFEMKMVEITYNKEVKELEKLNARLEIARKQGNTELARKYRREYIELKSEIDAYAMQIIINNER